MRAIDRFILRYLAMPTMPVTRSDKIKNKDKEEMLVELN